MGEWRTHCPCRDRWSGANGKNGYLGRVVGKCWIGEFWIVVNFVAALPMCCSIAYMIQHNTVYQKLHYFIFIVCCFLKCCNTTSPLRLQHNLSSPMLSPLSNSISNRLGWNQHNCIEQKCKQGKHSHNYKYNWFCVIVCSLILSCSCSFVFSLCSLILLLPMLTWMFA